ncbi:MAG: hypothetical protein K2Y32_24270 [Candidatus Obscuribacterales bacterium]|uniref:Uncharacterized protein n=1 Tax=Candidatus Obscuribacter phosphatis TaxID=1906157 RepID=A0A8J7PPS8_9BACT|nr:hypothetical protein [Candidatus Obscuribacter phosphatis]MBX9942400.1 hypothetical protein [Candidatus Obscuribacterales bacterium]
MSKNGFSRRLLLDLEIPKSPQLVKKQGQQKNERIPYRLGVTRLGGDNLN